MKDSGYYFTVVMAFLLSFSYQTFHNFESQKHLIERNFLKLERKIDNLQSQMASITGNQDLLHEKSKTLVSESEKK
jgi:hypothetical protein